MLDETFYLDGIDARSFGIQLQEPVSFSEAVPIIEAQSIPGRNGDLIWETGSYENRSGSASCFCLQKDVKKAVSLAGRFLMGKKGYRRLETSDDPDHFWLARVENSPQIATRLRTLSPFDIGFDCKPQRFLREGQNAITSPPKLFNKYCETALPFITVYGTGLATLIFRNEFGDRYFEIKEIGGKLYIDSETQNAYNDDGYQNANIYATSFPQLPPGETEIIFSGDIEYFEIIPRWWEV